MRRGLIILSLTLIASAATLSAHDVRSCEARSNGQIAFIADSIDFRQNLTRLYGRLSGAPHTSGRIDQITVSGTTLKEPLSATDIDGVDFRRWFQWEEDGIIPVEIDFPAMNPGTAYIFQLQGPKGESQWELQVESRRKQP